MSKAEEIYQEILRISEPRNAGKLPWEIETRTEKTARLPLEQLVWALCRPDAELANQVMEIARQRFDEAWEKYGKEPFHTSR